MKKFEMLVHCMGIDADFVANKFLPLGEEQVNQQCRYPRIQDALEDGWEPAGVMVTGFKALGIVEVRHTIFKRELKQKPNLDLASLLRVKDTMKSGNQWAQFFGVVVMDPDGWRSLGMDMDYPISLARFLDLLNVSTIGG